MALINDRVCRQKWKKGDDIGYDLTRFEGSKYARVTETWLATQIGNNMYRNSYLRKRAREEER